MEGLEQFNSEEEIVVSEAMVEIRRYINKHFSSAWATAIDRGQHEIAAKVEEQVKHFIVTEIKNHFWHSNIRWQWQLQH